MDGADLDPMGTAILAYRRFADRAAGAHRAGPTRLAGWTIGHLVDHVTWGAAMEATALRATRGRSAVEPRTLADAVDAFEDAALTTEVGAATPVILPAGTVPFAYAAALFAFEAALHDLDLRHALGEDDAELTASELTACTTVVGPMLDLIASEAPEQEVTIDLVGLGDGLRLRASDGRWQRTMPAGGPATTTVTGRPRDLVLFACGRLTASALDVQGEPLHATRFKSYFPGP